MDMQGLSAMNVDSIATGRQSCVHRARQKVPRPSANSDQGNLRPAVTALGQKFTHLYTGEQFAVRFLRSDNTNHRCKD